MDSIAKDGIDVFYICKGKQFNVFDEEMAIATAECFDRCSQIDKCAFPGLFGSIWHFWNSFPQLDINETKVGFKKLQNLIDGLSQKNAGERKAIASFHARTFSDTIKRLIEEIGENTVDM